MAESRISGEEKHEEDLVWITRGESSIGSRNLLLDLSQALGMTIFLSLIYRLLTTTYLK